MTFSVLGGLNEVQREGETAEKNYTIYTNICKFSAEREPAVSLFLERASALPGKSLSVYLHSNDIIAK